MPLNDELNSFFSDEKERVIEHPLVFKAKLGIGEKAYAFLRYRENLSTFSEAMGVGATASAVASSGLVANAFFVPATSGFMGSALSALGLGASAVTPVGWVLAAGVVAGGAYIGISNIFASPKKDGMVVIPKYINTPLELIGAALLELMLPISLKIAHTDGEISESEYHTIFRHYTQQWGFHPMFVTKLMNQFQTELGQVSYSKMVESLVMYTEDSKDCDRDAILSGVIAHLQEVAEADGHLHEQELIDLRYISEQLLQKSAEAGIGQKALDSLKASLSAVNGLARDTSGKAYGAAVGGTQSLFSKVQAGAKTTKEVLDGAARDVARKLSKETAEPTKIEIDSKRHT